MPNFIQFVMNAIIWICVIPAIAIVIVGTVKQSIDQIKFWIENGEI